MAGFKIKVKTDNTGTSNNDQFTLPVYSSESYNYTVYWGDGNSDVVTTSSHWTHTYASAGTYEITIDENVSGGFPAIYFYNRDDRLKVIEISAWGTNLWTYMRGAFWGCSNMTITATDEATIYSATVTTWVNAFNGCTGLTTFPVLNFTNATNLQGTFLGCTGLTTFPLTAFPNVNSINSMFSGCTGLTSLPAFSFPSATILYGAFRSCTSLTSFPIISIPSCTQLDFAWADDTALTSFPLINTSSVHTFYGTWRDCEALTSFPLIDLSSATSLRQTWEDCDSLTSFPLLDTSTVTDLRDTWEGCSGLTSFPLLDFSSVLDADEAFYFCTGLTTFPEIDFPICTNFDGTWNNCQGLVSFPDIDLSSGVSFDQTWNNCYSLASFNTTDFSSATTLYYTWLGCAFTEFPAITIPNVTQLYSTWIYCRSLITMPMIDVSGVTYYRDTFNTCEDMTSFPLWDFSNATTLASVWEDCISLVDIPAFDFTNISTGADIFDGCTLSTESYSNLLIAMAADCVNTGVSFDGGSSKYYGFALAAKTYLDVTRTWYMIDGGQDTEVYGTLETNPSVGTEGTTFTITSSDAGFYGAMIVKDSNASGLDLVSITVASWNEMSVTVPVGYSGPNIYIENPVGLSAVIIGGFELFAGLASQRLDLSFTNGESLDIVQIPFQDLYAFSQEIILDEVPVRLVLNWNAEAIAWNLDLYDLGDNLLVAGMRLVLGLDVLSRYTTAGLPGGKLMVIDPAEGLSDIGIDDFTNERNLQLVYLNKSNF